MTPEEQMLEQEMMDYLYSYNQYGAGPGQLQSTKDLYKGLGYQEDAVSDIFKIAGIYPEDLLGLAPAPEAPGPAPVMPEMYQSDLANAYRGNTLAQVIMQEVAQGTDPVLAANTAIAKYNENPDMYTGMVPQSTSTGFNNSYDPVVGWANEFATDFATDYSKGMRENQAAMSEYQRALDDYAAKDEAYFRYNNPVSGLYEYRDPVTGEAPTLESFREQLGLNRGNFGGVKNVPGRDYGAYDRWDAGRKERGGSGIKFEPGVTRFDNQAFTRAGLAANATPRERSRGITTKGRAATGATRDVQMERDRRSKQVYNQLANQRIASGREIENQRRMALTQTLLGMR